MANNQQNNYSYGSGNMPFPPYSGNAYAQLNVHPNSNVPLCPPHFQNTFQTPPPINSYNQNSNMNSSMIPSRNNQGNSTNYSAFPGTPFVPNLQYPPPPRFNVPPPPIPPPFMKAENLQFTANDQFPPQKLSWPGPTQLPNFNQSFPVTQSNISHSTGYFQTPNCDVNRTPIDMQSNKIKQQQESTLSCNTDQGWVKEWASQFTAGEGKSGKPKSNVIKICDARELLKKCFHILQELKLEESYLNKHMETLSDDLWKSKLISIQIEKSKLLQMLAKFSDDQLMKSLKLSLKRRKKKRELLKLKRKNFQENKAEELKKREQLHNRIDAWLINMQDSVERAKIEESLKVEADSVLADVTRKKNEAKRQVALLSSLEKLRQIRQKNPSWKEASSNVDLSSSFTKVIEHLKELWERQLKEYAIEEQGLRVMLTEAVDARDKKEQLYDKKIFQQWEKVLFGEKRHVNPFYTVAERDVESFISVRKGWDRYIVEIPTSQASAIPIGWVIPVPPSSKEWNSHLVNQK